MIRTRARGRGVGIKVCDRIGRSKPSVTARLSPGALWVRQAGRARTRTDTDTHTRADAHTGTAGILTLSVIDTGLDLENHCHSSLRRSNSHIISHKGKRDGGNKRKKKRRWRRRMERERGR